MFPTIPVGDGKPFFAMSYNRAVSIEFAIRQSGTLFSVAARGSKCRIATVSAQLMRKKEVRSLHGSQYSAWSR